jgi:uncharacterized RDD family membrane protein YckC
MGGMYEYTHVEDNRYQAEKQRNQVDYIHVTVGRRIGASILDGQLTSLAVFFLTKAFTGYSGPLAMAFALLVGVGNYAYTIGCHAKWGKTLGKFLFGLTVVRNDDGKALGWGKAALRDLVPLALGTLMVLYAALSSESSVFADINAAQSFTSGDRVSNVIYIIYGAASGLWALVDAGFLFFADKHRALHDFVAGSVVKSDHSPVKAGVLFCILGVALTIVLRYVLFKN